MNKLHTQYEGPIDIPLLHLSAGLLPLAYRTGHTPNILTTYSFISGVLAVLALWHRRAATFACLWTAGYFFDCMDGQFARKYNMVTRLGDLYDHATDLLVNGALLVVCWVRYRDTILASRWLRGLGVIWVVMAILLVVHIGCQQRSIVHSRQRGQPPETLDGLVCMCPAETEAPLRWTRFFSAATFNLMTVVVGVSLVMDQSPNRSTPQDQK